MPAPTTTEKSDLRLSSRRAPVCVRQHLCVFSLCFLSVRCLSAFSVCVFSVCVFSLCFCLCFLSVCFLSVCFLSVFSVCVFCLYVFCLCFLSVFLSVCFLSVFSLFDLCVFCLYVFCLCVFSLCFQSALPATSQTCIAAALHEFPSSLPGTVGCYQFFFLNRWLHRISRILAVLDYEGVKQATPEVLRPKRKSSAHFTMT